ncbi:CobW family GTP-binding protein [Paraglaciecola sp. 2405UD69-4]|uniref:CobW family GTP-binding protein n=1 Tax=Paraglaciecola sp. 2405UD69-4 TaxID=3391836 RepID=UPI0039C8ECE6
MTEIKHVPTNIITGALGVGKTTLIQSLLKAKPNNERWAVLVNEFGEIGVDGALLTPPQDSGIFIREVPGGCMCCTSGLPMQIALNMLLAKAKPHRLLIEPTGLGHPKEVLQTLSAEHYQEVLDIGSTLTLIDTRKLASQRWREHQTFQEQLEVADHIIATKSDLYEEDLLPSLKAYLASLNINNTPISLASQGEIDINILFGQSKFCQIKNENVHSHTHSSTNHSHTINVPESGSIKVANNGEGHYSYGWICSPNVLFEQQTVMDTLSSLAVDRLKAVLITPQGVITCNLSDGCLSINTLEIDDAADSRIEFITQDKQLAIQTCEKLETAFGLASE